MYGIVSKRSAANVLGILAIAAAVAGCGSDASSSVAPQAGASESIPEDWRPGERPALRYHVDAARGRLWALTLRGVELYDIATRKRVAQIALPNWIWAGEPYSCPPDLALGPGGEAVISSDVVPILWRIDPVTLEVSKHDLALYEDNGRDIGFTGLAYSTQQGAYFAVSAFHGSLWRIDQRLTTARPIPLSTPLPKACGLAVQVRAPDQRASRFVGLCVRADRGNWLINLAPDQRSGYVSTGHCGS